MLLEQIQTYQPSHDMFHHCQYKENNTHLRTTQDIIFPKGRWYYMPTKAINLRIDTELLEYLQKRADKEHRTLSNMIISILLTEKECDDDKRRSITNT